MFRFATFAASFLLVELACGQTIDVTSPAANTPEFRPALLGTGPDALINRIDTNALIHGGQKNAAVMFNCSVLKTGELGWSMTYRGTSDSKALDQEVLTRLRETKFIPAIFNRQPVDVIYYGTVTFAVIDGKPRLRIFANQETDELKKESDFVGPQPFFGFESKFTGFHYPQGNSVIVKGSAVVKLKVDEYGNLKDIKLEEEEPPFLGFGDSAVADLRFAKFVPAFRNGKPTACEVSLPVFYVPKG